MDDDRDGTGDGTVVAGRDRALASAGRPTLGLPGRCHPGSITADACWRLPPSGPCGVLKQRGHWRCDTDVSFPVFPVIFDGCGPFQI